MIRIYIGSSLDPKEINVMPTDYLSDVLKDNGINPNSGIITLNNRRLGDAELQMTIADLGITDGDFVTLTQKLMSA